MLDGLYVYELETPVVKGSGKIYIETQGDKLKATVDIPVLGKQRAEGTYEGNSFEVSGSTRILLLGKIDYTATGSVDGDTLSFTLRTDQGELPITATRA